jgi:hypothetical protein
MKCISVPMTAEAMRKIDFDECNKDDVIEVILNDDEYDALWKSGVIKAINEHFDLIIDDYEDEKLIGVDNLVLLKRTVEEFWLGDQKNTALNKLMSQINNAITFNTGIFFYF